jgi:hypothetical protein
LGGENGQRPRGRAPRATKGLLNTKRKMSDEGPRCKLALGAVQRVQAAGGRSGEEPMPREPQGA